MIDFIYRSLTTEISPMVYTMMFVSIFIGFCFMTDLLVSPATSVLYKAGTLVDLNLWGGVLFGSAGTSFIGMVTKNQKLIIIGACIAFVAWSFPAISLILTGNYYAAITFGIFHMVFQSYVYLAASLNVLYRKPVERL